MSKIIDIKLIFLKKDFAIKIYVYFCKGGVTISTSIGLTVFT